MHVEVAQSRKVYAGLAPAVQPGGSKYGDWTPFVANTMIELGADGPERVLLSPQVPGNFAMG